MYRCRVSKNTERQPTYQQQMWIIFQGTHWVPAKMTFNGPEYRYSRKNIIHMMLDN